MSLSLTKSVNAGFTVALGLLLVVGAVATRTTKRLVETADHVAHTHSVLERLSALDAAFAATEASRRGFVLTSDEAYAQDLRTGASRVRALLVEIRALTADNPARLRQLDALEPMVTARQRLLRSSVELKRTRPGDLAAQLRLMREGRSGRDEILRLLGSLQAEERSLLRVRDAAAEASARRSIVVTLAGSVAATIVVGLALIMIHREIRERRRAEEAVRKSETLYRTLLSQFPNGAVLIFDRDLRYRLAEGQTLAEVGLSKAGLEGKTIWEALPPETCEAIEPAYRAALAGTATRSDIPFAGRIYEVHFSPIRDDAGEVQAGMVVTQDVTGRRQAEGEVRRLNRELERNVTELTEVNRELEAFSYSVSHDLRAPLRHVHGFVDLLTRRAQGALDETGRRHLATIALAAKRMGELIDDLLTFSRVGRAELARRRVDLTRLVEEVIRQLGEEHPGRDVAWKKNGLPEVVADPSLLRVVLTNLLGNAVKYTRGRGNAEVEVGSRWEGDELVVFVRDNGVGFDMKYVDKLFGVFQRLHREEEFEGTGIGLATVRRIIHRHGGRTWAEGTVGGGAVFYFSLPSSGEASS